MRIHNHPIKVRFAVLLLSLSSALLAFSQAKTPTPLPTPSPSNTVQPPKEEVLRISTNLIQTGASVFNKNGQFVDNLKQEDFELSIDGKPVPITFFEQISNVNIVGGDKTTAGKTIVTSPPSLSPAAPNKPVAGSGGKKILFFVDDIHLAFENLKRTKDTILNFVNREMTAEDSVAIVATNGKNGFSQPFTNDKDALRAAVAKLLFTRDTSGIDRVKPPMSEYEALMINRGDKEMTDIFVTIVSQSEQEGELDSIRERVRGRAQSILAEGALISRYTYSYLEQAVRNSASQPGRKLVFLYSDGFLLDTQNTDSSKYLSLITDAALRANAVIYSFDAKGLEARLPEVSNNINTGVSNGTSMATTNPVSQKDFFGNSYRMQAGKQLEDQDGLNVLANSTGGRFIRKTNDLQTELTKALREASVYYLLVWQPDAENSKPDKLKRVQVSVKNHPELKVRLQNGYLDGTQNTATAKTAETTAAAPKKPALSPADEQLNAAVNLSTPILDLPTSVTVNYLDVQDQGATLAAVLKIKSDALEFTTKGDEASAGIDLLGVIYDAAGTRTSSFRKLLNFNVAADRLNSREDLYYNYQTKLAPGSYELRVAARDVKSGRVGSSSQHIEIPDLSSQKLSLSSLLLSEVAEDAAPRQVLSEGEFVLGDTEVSVDRNFSHSSLLRYLVFVYNAASGSAPPDLTLQTQVLKSSAVVINGAARQISIEGQDLARVSYAAEIPLSSLPAGHYKLLITVHDKTAKTVATQSMEFDVK